MFKAASGSVRVLAEKKKLKIITLRVLLLTGFLT